MKNFIPGREERLAYEKPAIVHRELLESIAGTCDTSDPVNGKTGSGDNCTTANS
jgi:hypothetical protein